LSPADQQLKSIVTIVDVKIIINVLQDRIIQSGHQWRGQKSTMPHNNHARPGVQCISYQPQVSFAKDVERIPYNNLSNRFSTRPKVKTAKTDGAKETLLGRTQILNQPPESLYLVRIHPNPSGADHT